MDKQQTAVDYYSKQIGKLTSDLVTGRISGKQFVMLEIKLLEQAKEMEKDQMIEFGELCWKNLLRSDVIMRPRDVYNETYGGNK
jgi:hypothetical protein